MTIQDFGGSYDVNAVSELDAVLGHRHAGGYNGFWLFHEQNGAAMSILVKDDLAYAHYFPTGRVPGFRSVGNISALPNGMTVFRLDTPEQEQPILNEAVISFATAAEAAKEFFLTKQLPRSLEWFEL